MLDNNAKKFDDSGDEPLVAPTNHTSQYSGNSEGIDSEGAATPYKKKLVRQTGWRWVMLSFGCFFLMGSYFCYDNPAPLKTQLEAEPFNLTDPQWSGLYSIYSFPNMVLPLFGGIFIDKIGIRAGLILFTVVLTIGQLIFAIGGYKESYLIMMIGRFVFGLGGESMTVAQSAIVSSWFQGKELAFAFGINLSVARIGSSINGPVETSLADNYSVGLALMVGFGVCCFSLLMAFALVYVDAWGAKKDDVQVALTEDDKFKFKDLKQFNRLPFWLVTMSCVIIYMVIFPYVQYSADMLKQRYGFGNSSGTYYALPYIISGVMSPILGITIDKIGKRALFIMTSSVLILLAALITMLIPSSTEAEGPEYLCLIPLVLLGIGYSVYAAALWGCIPYTVPARLVGTAYGLCTAIQNIGLTISPLVGGVILDKTDKEDGYFYLMVYFAGLACCGIFFNVWLYIDDLKNRDGILDKVDEGENLEELMTSPTGPNRREHGDNGDGDFDIKDETNADEQVKKSLLEYHQNKETRDTLKRSQAKNAASSNH